MEYEFIKAVEEVIENCKMFGRGGVQREDDDGNITLWLETEWWSILTENMILSNYIFVIAILEELHIVDILRKLRWRKNSYNQLEGINGNIRLSLFIVAINAE